jgi:hypothetical protein
MSYWVPIVVSGVSGAVVTLLGVSVGSITTSRSQKQQWIRDKQIEACTTIIEESTRMQLALRRQWKQNVETDWTKWNQALAVIWLVCVQDVINSAKTIDRIFWTYSANVKADAIATEKEWAKARDEMEMARLNFINVTRRSVVRSLASVADPPVARPSISSDKNVNQGPPVIER